MSAGFDPYYTWLAIPPDEQPPHLYRLLSVKALEENLDVIETAADRQMKHLRDYQSGKNADACQKLLNEISAARLTLLDPAKKAPYDAELRAKLNAIKQAELKKAREERPLATAKPLPTAAPLAAKPAKPTPAVQIGGTGGLSTSAAPKPRAANNIVPLIVIGVVALVLLAVGGVVAMMLLGKGEPVVAVNTNPDGVPPIATPETEDPASETPAPPVVPPVIPPKGNNDKPPGETPSTSEVPPAIDDPDSPPTTPDPATPIDEEPIDDEPADDEEALAVAEEEPAEEAPKKLPVPEKAEREAKRKDILAIFPIAKAKTFEEKGELAAQLISTAGETVDDPAAVFAMLNLAREQAAEAGHIKLAFEATDMLGETFDFDAAAVRIASLQQASRAQLPPAAKRDIVIAGMDVIDELSAADKFDEADTLSDRMLALARPLRDAALIKELAEQKRNIDDVAASFKKAQTAFETLKSSPNDADANLAAGKYLAFVKQDWQAGLTHLAQGSDATLVAAAKAEIAAPTASADQEKLADAWWAAAEAQKDAAAKSICRAQAVYWYREVVDELTGLVKAKAEKRIEQAEDVNSLADRIEKRRIETVFLDDIAETSFKVGWGKLGKRGISANGPPIVSLGNPVQHALAACAVENGIGHVSYSLDGTYEVFEAVAGFADGNGQPRTAITFQVRGDGKVLWKSAPNQKYGTGEPCRVNIRNVRSLSLETECPGKQDGTDAIWFYPRISRVKGKAKPDGHLAPRLPNGDRIVYLDDLEETESSVSFGVVGKHGNVGYDESKPKVFAGTRPDHALSTCAHTRGTAYVTYNIQGKYQTLEATVGLWQEPNVEGSVYTPVTFKVVGDGKTLWESPAIQKHSEGHPCKVDIKNVKVLQLAVDCPGAADRGWAVWIDPRLTGVKSKTASTSAEPDLGIFSRDPAELESPSKTEPIVYLDDLKESALSLPFGELGKHGDSCHGNREYNFGGEIPAHTLSMHGAQNGVSSVSYELDGKYSTFAATAALWQRETHRERPSSAVPLVFRVVGDGRELWRSKPLQDHGASQDCNISMRGVKLLTLEVHCPGDHMFAWSVWINPQLTLVKSKTTPSAKPPIGRIDPSDAGEISPDPAKPSTFGGHTYLLVTTPLNRKEALAACAAQGGYLARIESEAEQEFALALVRKSTPEKCDVWIDGSDADEQGVWKFSDGRAMQWTDWAYKEPNNGEGKEDFIALYAHENGKWNDFAGDKQIAYLVEWDAPRETTKTKTPAPRPRRIDLLPRPVIAVASGSNHHTVFVNGEKLLDCGRDKATNAACILRPGDVITVRLGDRFDIKSFWMIVISDKGEALFETSEKWIGYLPADDARWWDVSTKGLKQEPAQFTGDGREYVGHVQGAAAAALPTLKSKDKAQPIFSPLDGGDNRAFLAYVVTVDDLKPKKK